MLVGFTIDRRRGQTDFKPVILWTDAFIMVGAWLDADIEDQCLVLPAIPGLGHLRRGPSLCQLLNEG